MLSSRNCDFGFRSTPRFYQVQFPRSFSHFILTRRRSCSSSRAGFLQLSYPNRLIEDKNRIGADRLLNTAAALFRAKGYAATTTREIAAALGIQQASLYYHAKSKEELLYKVFVFSLEQMQTQVAAAIAAEQDPLEKIRVFIRTHLAALLAFQSSNATMMTELRALSGAYRSDVVARRRNYSTLVRTMLEQAQDAGGVRKDISAQYLYLALLNLLNWSMLWFRTGQELTPDQLANIFTTLFMEGVVAVDLKQSLAGSTPAAVETMGVRQADPRRVGRETSRRLLVVAAALFAKKGYRLTSMREIAQGLGIQKASLYYHTATKEDLLFKICEASVTRVLDSAKATIRDTQNPLDRIRSLISAHVQCVLQDQDLHATALAEMRELSHERLKIVEATWHEYRDLLRSVLYDAQNAGLIRENVEIKYAALGLLGMVTRVEVWFRPGGPLSPQQLGGVFAEIFLTGARAA